MPRVTELNVNGERRRVDVDAGGTVTCDLAGRTSTTTSLYLFTEVDGALQQRFVDVPPFEGSLRISA
jgi:hypothetical protein